MPLSRSEATAGLDAEDERMAVVSFCGGSDVFELALNRRCLIVNSRTGLAS